MKKKSNLFILLLAAVLVSCGGGKKSGKPDFGDDEYAVRTVGVQSAEACRTTYPATNKGSAGRGDSS